MFIEFNWLFLLDYFVYRKVILVYKVLYGLMLDYLNVFKYVLEVS